MRLGQILCPIFVLPVSDLEKVFAYLWSPGMWHITGDETRSCGMRLPAKTTLATYLHQDARYVPQTKDRVIQKYFITPGLDGHISRLNWLQRNGMVALPKSGQEWYWNTSWSTLKNWLILSVKLSWIYNIRWNINRWNLTMGKECCIAEKDGWKYGVQQK